MDRDEYARLMRDAGLDPERKVWVNHVEIDGRSVFMPSDRFLFMWRWAKTERLVWRGPGGDRPVKRKG